MTRVPILTEVVLRAWGTDDPRVLGPLRAENQAGSRQRLKGKPVSVRNLEAIKERARDAGWPTLDLTEQYKAATTAVRRLEGADFKWNGTQHHDLFRVSAYEGRNRRELTVAWDGDDDTPATIFDE